MKAILNKRLARAIKAYDLYLGGAGKGHSIAKRIKITKMLTLRMQACARRAGGWPASSYSL